MGDSSNISIEYVIGKKGKKRKCRHFKIKSAALNNMTVSRRDVQCGGLLSLQDNFHTVRALNENSGCKDCGRETLI